MTWRELERDDRHRVPLIVLRCRGCGRMGVNTNPFLPMPRCCCEKR